MRIWIQKGGRALAAALAVAVLGASSPPAGADEVTDPAGVPAPAPAEEPAPAAPQSDGLTEL